MLIWERYGCFNHIHCTGDAAVENLETCCIVCDCDLVKPVSCQFHYDNTC